MKIFEIYDEDNRLSIGTLIYYEKIKAFIIELQEYLDEWTAPLLFTSYVKKHIFTIPSEISFLWVKERVIPSGRQNIGDILKQHKLKEYDEMTFLELSQGKCSQDELCIKKLSVLPDYVETRREKNLSECTIVGQNELLCFFADGLIKKVDLTKLPTTEDLEKIQKNSAVFETAKVGAGGYPLVFNDVLEISARVLYEEGRTIPLKKSDFLAFVNQNLLDTSDSCELMECSRQNLSYLVKENQLVPTKGNVKGNLYLKGDVLRNIW